MRAVTIICFISIAYSNAFKENTDVKLEEQNTTTLYPITSLRNYSKNKLQVNSNNKTSDEVMHRWTDLNQFIEADNTNNGKVLKKGAEGDDDAITYKEDDLRSKDRESTTWKINATFAPSSGDNQNDTAKERLNHFKPSPHLGSFYNEDNFFVPPQPSKETFTPYTPPSLSSFGKDFYRLNYKTPMDYYQRPIENPHRIENVLPRTADVKFESGLEIRPTAESPARVPAGGLYKVPDAFQEKPSSEGDSQDFELQFKEHKESSVKKSASPWKNILHLVTSLLPVGLIVSALTPSVITLDNVNNNQRFPGRMSRRSAYTTSLPHISEGCKRRLLCEIHSDQHYVSDPSFIKRRPCYKIPCEDPHSTSRLLRWLLEHHGAGHHPRDHDRRGYIT